MTQRDKILQSFTKNVIPINPETKPTYHSTTSANEANEVITNVQMNDSKFKNFKKE